MGRPLIVVILLALVLVVRQPGAVTGDPRPDWPTLEWIKRP